MYKPNSKWTWLFLIIASVQALVGLGLEGYAPANFFFLSRDRGGFYASRGRKRVHNKVRMCALT